jgi:hypothetical protein
MGIERFFLGVGGGGGGKLTRGYWRGLEKPEDLCTLPYHQGAHIPSNSLGPASHLKRGNNSNWTWWDYICISQQKCNTRVSIVYNIHTSTSVAGKECPDPHRVHSGQPACEVQTNWIHWTANVKIMGNLTQGLKPANICITLFKYYKTITIAGFTIYDHQNWCEL